MQTRHPRPMSTWRRQALALLLGLPMLSWAQGASNLTPDLQRIARAGEIVIGVRESALPFSFIQADGEASGYSVAVCQRVADQLSKTLGLPDLKVRYNNVTPLTRTLLVREGVVDMECGATSHTEERAKTFLFSSAFGVEEERLVSLTSKPVKGIAELSGKRVAVTEGSTSQERLKAQVAAGGLKAELVPVRNAARGYYALKDGKADAYIGSGEIFLGESLRRGGRASELLVAPMGGSQEPLAIMMRKDRPGLKAVADQVIQSMASSGELARLYATWFQAPLPQVSVNLALAPSQAWVSTLAQPNDKPARP